MSFLDRLVRAPGAHPGSDAASQGAVAGETETVRRIAARLASQPPGRARFLAGYAYVLARAAHADLDITDAETTVMATALVQLGGLDEAQALLVVEMAKLRSLAEFGTEDYLVTREFSGVATHEEKLAVLRACFAVSAADDAITNEEAHAVNEIARELDIDRPTLNAIREAYVDQFTAIRAARRLARR